MRACRNPRLSLFVFLLPVGRYLRLEDKVSGTVRLCKGEQLVFPTETEVISGKVMAAVQLKVSK